MKPGPKPSHKAPKESVGRTVALTSSEQSEVRKRGALRAEVVFETVRREGESELKRAPTALAFSGLAAGLSMGFSLVAMGMLRSYLPHAPWRVLVENFGYTSGFVIVILGRQQLFTENTVTAVLPLLEKLQPAMFARVARLWAIVLAANVLGTAIFAFAVALTPIFDDSFKAAFLEIGRQTLEPSAWSIGLRGIFAGWLLALMVWLLPSADTQKLFVIILVTYLVGALGLSHVVAGSVDALYVVAAGKASLGTYFAHFLAPVLAGNILGGVLLVSLLNFGQVAPESDDDSLEQ